MHGTAAVRAEWQRALEATPTPAATPSDIENLEYVLEKAAGCSDIQFQNNWQRDRGEDGSLLECRMRADGTAMLLDDFLEHDNAKKAKLTRAHVLALRLYTTSAFRSINKPLRNLARSSTGEIVQPLRLEFPHPLPCTVVLISDGLKKLRACIHNIGPSSPLPSPGGAIGLAGDDKSRGTSRRWTSGSPSSAASAKSVDHGGLELRTLPPAGSSGGPPRAKKRTQRRSSVGVATGVAIEIESVSSDSPAQSSMVSGELDEMVGQPRACSWQRLWRLYRFMCVRLQHLLGLGVRDGATESLTGSSRLPSQRLRQTGEVILWRGMSGTHATDSFLAEGGSELAPCSTTSDVDVAMRYARDWTPGRGFGQRSLIFRVNVENPLQQGADLEFLSAFPHEKEFLYPPLSFFKPVSKTAHIVFDDTEFVVVNVRATVA